MAGKSHKNTKAVHLLLIFSMNCSTDASGFNLKQGHIMMKQNNILDTRAKITSRFLWKQKLLLKADFCPNFEKPKWCWHIMSSRPFHSFYFKILHSTFSVGRITSPLRRTEFAVFSGDDLLSGNRTPPTLPVVVPCSSVRFVGVITYLQPAGVGSGWCFWW